MSDEIFMRRALELAALGKGRVSTNPMVGCVIVKEGKIIGEGYHRAYGGPHAEVNAIHSIPTGMTAEGATAYVSLEPCSHHGKTPPCADLLIAHKLARVVVGSTDPNPTVGGKGIARLRENGIKVESELLGEVEKKLNRRFRYFHESKRPFVILKWAQTADGFIARTNYDSKWISNHRSRQLVHQWRAEEDAILVGFNTAKYDDPSLTVREWEGLDPTRIVLDKHCQLSHKLKLFDRSVRTIIFNSKKSGTDGVEFVKLDDFSVESLLEALYDLCIQSVFVEGGAATLDSFLKSGIWDEARIFISDQKFESGIAAPVLTEKPVKEETIFGDKLLYYSNDSER